MCLERSQITESSCAYQGKRGGKQHISIVAKRIPVLPPSTRCDRPRHHLNATRFADTRNLLNIQVMSFDRNFNLKSSTRDKSVPSILLWLTLCHSCLKWMR